MSNIENFENIDEVIESYFGTWIDKLFGGAEYWHKSNTFGKQKESFFYLLKKLLYDGLVVLCPPISLKDALIRKQYNKKGELEWAVVWDISNESMIQYMRDVFPKDVKNENDDKLIDFWFSDDCPQIGWVDKKTGEIIAS